LTEPSQVWLVVVHHQDFPGLGHTASLLRGRKRTDLQGLSRTGSGLKLKILLRYFLTNYTNYQPMTITVSEGTRVAGPQTTLESAVISCTRQIGAQYGVHTVATGRIPLEGLAIASIEEQADRFGEVARLALPAVQRSVDALADRRTAVGRILHADRRV